MYTNELFILTLGPQGGDCTVRYYITLLKECTVGDFINFWLENYKSEWGYIGIHKKGVIFGDPYCEYRHGELVSSPLPKDILDKKIIKVFGYGGWSRSDIEFII